MTRSLIGFLSLLLVWFSSPAFAQTLRSPQSPKLGFMIHGGAGVIDKAKFTPEREQAYRDALRDALLAGYAVLQAGGDGADAVEAAIVLMEDSPLFNAGKGAVFTSDGRNELDAAVMDGATRNAGTIAAVHRVKNPIKLARIVMNESPHVMMVGHGAETFGGEHGIETVDEKYFFTQRRWDALQKRIEKEKEKDRSAIEPPSLLLDDAFSKYGTVGAVALDAAGNLYAGTSTGGMTYKRYGRVGDVPIIGAGTYADNATCAVSATGHGEYFIRVGVARDIAAMMAYAHMGIQQAADAALAKVKTLGGTGGVIAIDALGNMAVSFNSLGMYRAYVNASGEPVVEIFGSE